MLLPVIFIMGATATGKTAIAEALFKQYPVDIISVDSAMVYKGMDIGTAKPPRKSLQAVPHRLIDICEPDEAYSAARFREDALREIHESHAQQRIPLLVGGTGLYFRALESGISDLPEADENVRRQLAAEAMDIGWEAMHARLATVDPIAAERIHPNDPQRIQRALEVYAISGRNMTAHCDEDPLRPLPFDIIKIILNPEDRAVLHERIKQRFMKMLDDGLVEEVRRFHEDSRFAASLPSMRMVGYRQVWNYLDGDTDYDTMVDKGIIATRQLAKRQMTWLRKEENGIWFDCDESGLLDKISLILGENTHLLS